MIRRFGVLGISLLCFATIISCEKDFNDVGSNVVNNTKFETGEILLDVEITSSIDDPNLNLKSVRADNIAIGTLGEYWLGVYNNKNAKKIEASIVSQLSLPSNLKTEDVKKAAINGEIDSIFVLDKVILKLPYTATNIGKEADGKPKFRLDSVLGNKEIFTSLKVFRNNTYLNVLDPKNPINSNSFQSDKEYEITDETIDLLNEDPGFTFKPNATDTLVKITRSYSDGRTFNSEIKLSNKAPFIAIPLNKDKMKKLFWDEFKNSNFKTVAAFNNYFRGVIIKSEGDNGAILPISLLATAASASIDFHYTITRFEKKEGEVDLVYKDTVPTNYSFPLSGVRNSTYKMTAATVAAPANNFTIQGTAGTMAKIKIIDDSKLKELRANNWLINDASLSLYVNQTINTDKKIVPQRLFIYQDIDKSPTQISDAYTEASTFGGNLESTGDIPEKYTFSITDYISRLLRAEENTTIDPLILKVYNPTDNPIVDRTIDTNVKSYNWNPRAVTLLNGNEVSNGTRKAVLKISYSKEK